MAANIINAEVGSTVNVIGRSKVIARAGPIPGRTPTRVPSKLPIKPNIRFVRVSEPRRPSMNSITTPDRLVKHRLEIQSRVAAEAAGLG
jgi:hypothetical protein